MTRHETECMVHIPRWDEVDNIDAIERRIREDHGLNEIERQRAFERRAEQNRLERIELDVFTGENLAMEQTELFSAFGKNLVFAVTLIVIFVAGYVATYQASQVVHLHQIEARV